MGKYLDNYKKGKCVKLCIDHEKVPAVLVGLVT